jgi:hypothetical protein
MRLGYLGARCSVQKKVNSSCSPLPNLVTLQFCRSTSSLVAGKLKTDIQSETLKDLIFHLLLLSFFPPNDILLFYYPIFEFTIFFHLRLATISLSLSLSEDLLVLLLWRRLPTPMIHVWNFFV